MRDKLEKRDQKNEEPEVEVLDRMPLQQKKLRKPSVGLLILTIILFNLFLIGLIIWSVRSGLN